MNKTEETTSLFVVLNYWLTEHPTIVKFRWSHSQSWGSTWSFLITAISAYIAAATLLHLTLKLFRRRRAVPLGCLPALHSFAMAVISVVIFIGLLISAWAEINETRWSWRRNKTTPFQWLLCFPIGIRPSGRVFFWSYMFYLSRFLHLIRTFMTILRRKEFSIFQIFNQSFLILASFLWLEFSQSFQIVAILLTTAVYSVVYGYRFWTAVGLPGARFPFVVNCKILLLASNVICHAGVLHFHVLKGGCNGIGAWCFNSVLNGVILLLFLKFYFGGGGGDDQSTRLVSGSGKDQNKTSISS